MNENKQKGCITELTVMRAFIKLGYNVAQPYGDCERYDFIADVDGRMIRVQCKTATPQDDGEFIDIDFRKKRYVSGRPVTILYTNEEIDYYATCYEDKTYLIPFNECGIKKRLRIKPAKYERKHVTWAKDYEIETVINKLINGGEADE